MWAFQKKTHSWTPGMTLSSVFNVISKLNLKGELELSIYASRAISLLMAVGAYHVVPSGRCPCYNGSAPVRRETVKLTVGRPQDNGGRMMYECSVRSACHVRIEFIEIAGERQVDFLWRWYSAETQRAQLFQRLRYGDWKYIERKLKLHAQGRSFWEVEAQGGKVRWFLPRDVCMAGTMLSKDVCLSVRHTLVFCRNG